MSRTRNSAWNLLAGSGYALASAAAGLIAAPFLLRWLGSERMGAFKALTDWIGYLTFFDLGLSGALMASLAARIAKGDHIAVTKMLSAGFRAYRTVMLAQLAGAIAFVVALPAFIPVTQLTKTDLRITGTIALLPLSLTPLLTFRALAESRQRGYLIWLTMTAQVLAMNGLFLFAAQAGWGLIGQGVSFAVAQFIPLLVLAWDGMRTYPGVGKIVADQTDKTALWKLSRPTFIHGLTDKIGLVSDNIIIAWILGPAMVVPFFLTQQLAVMAQSQLRGLGNATWAGLAELYARGDKTRLHSRLLELTGLVSGLGWAVLIPIAANNRSFITLWVGQNIYAGNLVTWLACLNALLWAIYSLWGWVLLGTGHIRQWMPYAIASTLVNIVISVAGTIQFGFMGPLLGSSAGLLLVNSWALPMVVNRVIALPLQSLWRAALSPLRWSLPYAALSLAFAAYFPQTNWLSLLAVSAVEVVVGLLFWWRFNLGSAERAEWQSRVKSLLS